MLQALQELTTTCGALGSSALVLRYNYLLCAYSVGDMQSLEISLRNLRYWNAFIIQVLLLTEISFNAFIIITQN